MKIVEKEIYLNDELTVQSFTLFNSNGIEVTCLNYGCIVTEICVPDKNGVVENILLSYPTYQDYIEDGQYLGAVVGRVAGRISKSAFSIDEQEYTLSQNEGENHLHGGFQGLSRKIWNAERIHEEDAVGVRFTYISPDSDEGYPGEVNIMVTYLLNVDDKFSIRYEGNTDKTTLLTLTNHAYFNLSGNAKREILDHELMINGNAFMPINEESLPTGNLTSVENTAFDFRKGKSIRQGISSAHPQIEIAGSGYDHPFKLDKRMSPQIILCDKESGRKLEVHTDEDWVVVYTGNFLTSPSQQCWKYKGVCLETQALPNAINLKGFAAPILRAGERYHSTTTFRFGVC